MGAGTQKPACRRVFRTLPHLLEICYPSPPPSTAKPLIGLGCGRRLKGSRGGGWGGSIASTSPAPNAALQRVGIANGQTRGKHLCSFNGTRHFCVPLIFFDGPRISRSNAVNSLVSLLLGYSYPSAPKI